MTYPNSSGAVYKLIINGHEVYGQKDVIKYTFDDWEEKYVDDDDKTIHIEVVYGEKSEVDRLLDEYYSGSSDNPDDAGDNSETGASCGGCSSTARIGLCAAGSNYVDCSGGIGGCTFKIRQMIFLK